MPGVYDALTAKIAEHVGFEAIFQTGYGTSASMLALPDFGFYNLIPIVLQKLGWE